MGRTSMTSYLALCLFIGIAMIDAQTLTMFGDSLSDTGVQNRGGGLATWIQQNLQTKEVFPQSPYYEGRFSNGPVWVEYATQALGVPFLSFSAGGATSGAGYAQNGPLPANFAGFPGRVQVPAPNLYQQLNQFYQYTNNTANATDAYCIFIGNNDYFSLTNDGKNLTAEDVVDNIETVMDKLYSSGARRFILVTLPPVSVLPPSLTSNSDLVTQWADHNELLIEVAGDFNSTHPGSAVSLFRIDTLFIQIVSQAGQLGFTSSAPCYPVSQSGLGLESGVKVCSDPAGHFFFDTVHPTTTAHRVVGNAFAKQFGYIWGQSVNPAPALAPLPGAASN